MKCCFFGNVELHSTDRHRDSERNENNLEERNDDEQLAEHNDNSNTSSEFSVEEMIQKEPKTQSDFKE
jgi:hypothetical protein